MAVSLSPRRRPSRALRLVSSAPVIVGALAVVAACVQSIFAFDIPLAVAGIAAVAAVAVGAVAISRCSPALAVLAVGCQLVVFATGRVGWLGVVGLVASIVAVSGVHRRQLIAEHNRWCALLARADRESLDVFCAEEVQRVDGGSSVVGIFLRRAGGLGQGGRIRIGVDGRAAAGTTLLLDQARRPIAAVPTSWSAGYDRAKESSWAVPVTARPSASDRTAGVGSR